MAGRTEDRGLRTAPPSYPCKDRGSHSCLNSVRTLEGGGRGVVVRVANLSLFAQRASHPGKPPVLANWGSGSP